MTKVTSKLLTFLLSFAMVFTSIGWLGVSEVNAAEGNTTLTVQVVDQGGAFVAGAELEFSDGANSYYFDPTGADGIASLTLDEQNDPDDGTFDILIDESSKLEVIEGVTVTVAHDESTYAPYFAAVNGAAYNGETVTMKVKSSEPVAEAIDYVAVRANADEWKTWGIDFDAITADDFVLDVRPDSEWKAGHLPGATHVDVTAADSLTEDEKYIAADSAVAKALDKAFSDADGKRIVIVCIMGQTLAARTMQYFNETYFEGFGVDSSKVTYLIGGRTAIPEKDIVKTVDYVQVQKDPAEWGKSGIEYDAISADDFILDVRADGKWNEGHLAGSTHVDITVSDYLDNGYVVAESQLAQDLDAAYAASDSKRIVIICNGGQTLAARAMQYFNETYFNGEGVDSSKVTYLIGGRTAIPEEDLVLGPAPDTTVPRTLGDEKTRAMTVNIDMSKYDAGKVVRVWVPVPQTEDYQKISEPVFDAPTAATAEITTEAENGNKMLYIEWDADAVPTERKATLTFIASRSEAGHPELIAYDESAYEWPADVVPYITKESSMVTIGGIVKEYADQITKGKRGTLAKARAIYNWEVAHLERIDNNETLTNAKGETKTFEVEGCGYGNTAKILNDYDTFGRAGGHCTDLNSTFVALCRASGIPAREMFGIRMNDDATGGQHCWAEFYLPGTGWVFADPGDALKAIKTGTGMTIAEVDASRANNTAKIEYFWGTVDNNRIVLSRGRDITFNPEQSWGPCNTFGYPAAEVDGERLADFTDAKNFVYSISSAVFDENWTVDDFTFDGTAVTGLSAMGKFKRTMNKDLVIPEKNADGEAVTEIGAAGTGAGGLFATADEKFDTVTLPDTITKIGANAFREAGIKAINFPEGLKEIGNSAFQMNNLEDINLPDTLVTLGTGVFTSNMTIKSVHIPENDEFTALPDSTFGISGAASAENFTEVTIPSNIKSIGKRVFAGNAFTKIEVPASVTSIGDYAFSQQPSMSALETITLNEGLESIGGYVFRNCKAEFVILPSTVTTLNANAFRFDTDREKVLLLTDVEDQLNATGIYTKVVKSSNYHTVTSLSTYAADAIAELPSPSAVTLEDKTAIEKAKEVYEALSEDAQAALPAGSVEKLEGAEAAIMALEAQAAQAAAEEAQRIAEEKQAEAEAAAAAAEEAQKQAEADKAAAEAAQKAAEAAATEAEKAKQEAVQKQITAEAAAAAAAAAQSGANDKAVAIVALASDLVEATKVKTADYKAGTVKKLQTAMEKAQAILKNTSASKADIEKADSDLKAATKALVKKSANTLTVKAKKVTLKASKLKKKTQTVKVKKAFKVSKAKGKVTYKKTKGNKKITVSSKGKITVKKGLKKGTYNVKVKVSAAGNGDYKAGSKTVTVKIKVK